MKTFPAKKKGGQALKNYPIISNAQRETVGKSLASALAAPLGDNLTPFYALLILEN